MLLLDLEQMIADAQIEKCGYKLIFLERFYTNIC